MGGFDDLKAKAEQAASDHPDQVENVTDQAVERGGDAADKASGDKFADKIDQGQSAADQRIGQ